MPELNLLNPELIEIDVEAKTSRDVLERLAKLLTSKGYTKESYLEAVIEREKVFPTGLPTEAVGVAIPHADIKHVNKPAIAMAVLRNPVKFQVMGNPDEEVDVKLVFMLAITDPNIQLKLLSDLTEMFQNKQLLLKLVNSTNIKTIISLTNNFIKSNSDDNQKMKIS